MGDEDVHSKGNHKTDEFTQKYYKDKKKREPRRNLKRRIVLQKRGVSRQWVRGDFAKYYVLKAKG